jgi:hypothetical protein
VNRLVFQNMRGRLAMAAGIVGSSVRQSIKFPNLPAVFIAASVPAAICGLLAG